MGPPLTELTIGDDARAWEQAGFAVVEGCVTIGTVIIRLQPPSSDGPRGVISWAFDQLDGGGDRSIDGMLTLASQGPATPAATNPPHPNGVTGIDHVVVMTDDLERTSEALRSFGFEPRRRRAIPKSDPPRSQVFWWAGEVIIELVGPDLASGNEPATLWGLALTTPDLDAAAELLGDAMTLPRDAVQKGRRIASLRGKTLDLSVPIAFMSPHV